MDQGKRLAVNTICNVSNLVVHAGVGFFLAPFILQHLGPERNGIWALAGSSLAYANLLSLGLNSAVNRWIPMYLVEKNYDGINRVVNTTLVVYGLGAAALAVFVAILAWGFPSWFDIAPEYHLAARLTVCFVGMGLTCMVGMNVFPAVLSGLQRYDLITGSAVVTEILRVIAIVTAFFSGLGLIALGLASGLCHVVRNTLYVTMAWRKCPQLKIKPSLARWQVFREMFGYSVNTLMYACGQIIQSKAALILVGAAISTAAASDYYMPLILVGVIGRVVQVGAAAMKPAATHLDTQERSEQVRRLYLMGTKYGLMIVLPIATLVLAFAPQIMRIWLKDDFVPVGPAILMILTVAVTFRVWHVPAFYVVVGLGKHRMFGLVTIITAVASVLMGLLLATAGDLGVIGVAIGFAVPDVLLALFVITPYCCRNVEISVWKEITGSVVPALVASIPVIAALLVTRAYFEPTSLVGLMAVVGIAVGPALVGWWFWGFSAQEKKRFAAMLPRRRRG
ncbi:MAG: oligosaccharide flippase family protein [Planctomycetes bacterium]|nr:oligosaccharide flippase family protein [Planctomycetota bacterium]